MEEQEILNLKKLLETNKNFSLFQTLSYIHIMFIFLNP